MTLSFNISQRLTEGQKETQGRIHTCIDYSVVTLCYLFLVSVLKSTDKLTSCGEE